MTKKINVSGVAIREGVSRNGILYSKEELAKFAPTLSDKPILKDHRSEVDSTVGLVTTSESIDGGKTVQYIGWIKEDDTKVVEKIEDGRIKEVSIGAIVGRLVKESEDSDVMIAKDMHGMELSLTPTPGVQGTSIAQAFKIDENTGKKVQLHTIIEDFNTSSNPEIEEDILDIHAEDSEEEESESQSSEYSDKELNDRRLKNMEEGKENVTETTVDTKATEALEARLAIMEKDRMDDLTKRYSKLCEKLKIAQKENLSYDALKVVVESLEDVDEQPAEETKEDSKDESEESEASEESTEENAGDASEEAEGSENNEPETKSGDAANEDSKESLEGKYQIESSGSVGMSFYKI